MEASRLGLLEALFVFTAFLAPMNLKVFRAFTAYDLATAALGVLLVLSRRRLRPIPGSFRFAAIVLVAAGLVSTFRSLYPAEALLQVVQYAFIFFVQLPVVLTLARTRTVVHAALLAFVVGYLALVMVVMLLPQEQRAGRVVPFFTENPNGLASPTTLLAPIALYLAINQWRRGSRLLAVLWGGGALYLMLWALTASASRGSTIATIVSLGLFVTLGDQSRLNGLVVRGVVTCLVFLAIGTLAFWTGIFSDTLKDRVAGTFTSVEDQALAEERLALNRAGVRAFLSSPLVGTGFDNFRYVAQFYDDEAEMHEPHNVSIQLLAQSGIAGAGAFVFMIVRWAMLLIRTRSSTTSRSGRGLMSAFIGGMAGILTVSLIAPLILHRYYWLLYALGVATAVGLAQEEQRE